LIPSASSEISGPWQLAEGCRLHWKAWDDEFVIFDEGSGDTHLLDPLAAEVLKLLEQSPGDVADLARRTVARLDLAPDPDLAARVLELVRRFAAAGLVEPARP
jgi:PqqD family protein of HPr-rel-A system